MAGARCVRAMAVAAAIGLFTAGLPRAAGAWESDVHFVLTWWLAVRAGFSSDSAQEIARANQGRDEGSLQPATMSIAHVLLFDDVGASQDIRDKHFPTDAAVPNPPDRRRVVPNSAAARLPVEAAIQAADGNLALERLGHALHPFQDSWSHQGVPDSPLRIGPQIRPNLTWSHPAARGGWFSHDSDITALHVDDLMAAARATYDAYTAFLRVKPRYRANAGAEWRSLEPLVRQFASADTKQKKLAWLKANAPPLPAAEQQIAAISTPDGFITRTAKALVRVLRPSNPPPAPSNQRPPGGGAIDRVRRFLDSWFSGDIETALKEVAWSGVARQFAPNQFPNMEETKDWCRRFMTMWLVENHGAINASGHCEPTAAGYRELPTRPMNDGRFAVALPILQGQISADALFPVSAEVAGEPGAWGLMLQFSNSPRDAVIVILRRPPAQGQPAVIRMIWVVL
jgi:hypothetical protein